MNEEFCWEIWKNQKYFEDRFLCQKTSKALKVLSSKSFKSFKSFVIKKFIFELYFLSKKLTIKLSKNSGLQFLPKSFFFFKVRISL